jgi:hypothetical protein
VASGNSFPPVIRTRRLLRTFATRVPVSPVVVHARELIIRKREHDRVRATDAVFERATTDIGTIKPGWISVGLLITLSTGLRRMILDHARFGHSRRPGCDSSSPARARWTERVVHKDGIPGCFKLLRHQQSR